MIQNRTVGVISALLVGMTAAWLAAGPLNPPSGPVASTYKTLNEVEPRTAVNDVNTPGDRGHLYIISQPGSYYLTGNVIGVPGKNGIAISASGVTLDLNGFDVKGIATLGAPNGIIVTGNDLKAVTVVNGSVRNWIGRGLDLLGPTDHRTTACRAERIVAAGNGNDGVSVGRGAIVIGCICDANSGSGFVLYNGCVVRDCAANHNTGEGFNSGYGTASGGTISGCTAVSNGGSGFALGDGMVVTGCAAHSNGDIGFYLSIAGTVEQCVAEDNTGWGIVASPGGTIRNCVANYNSGGGISCGAACTIETCIARNNSGGGISCVGNCTVRGNTCDGNTAAGGADGITANGTGNRIEGNHCTQNNRGIHVIGQRNLVARNTCSANTLSNWVIVAGNRYGAIIDISAVNGAAVNGASAASNLSSTDPNANFSQ